MDIEEIHIDGDLNTLLFQILLFKGLFKDYHLPVGNTCNEITNFRRRSISFRDTEKVCDEKHHPNEKRAADAALLITALLPVYFGNN